MRVLFVARPDLPVPPPAYGGTERILASLIEGLDGLGHEVTLLGHPESTAACRVIPAREPRGRTLTGKRISLGLTRRRIVASSRDADLVHCTAPLHHILPLLSSTTRLVIHFHAFPTEGQLDLLARHVRHPELVRLVTCGRSMVPAHPVGDQRWSAIPNGIPVAKYRYSDRPADPPYLAYLGRMTEGKGVDLSIRIAEATRIPLRLAGPFSALASRGDHDKDREFRRTVVEPALASGVAAYAGVLGHDEKVALLGGALALLHPARDPEAFGLDVAESLACGTPVVALNRGEMPHLIRNGRTGFVCADLQSMVDAVGSVGRLDRAECRRDAEGSLDESLMVDRFVRIYRDLMSEPPMTRVTLSSTESPDRPEARPPAG